MRRATISFCVLIFIVTHTFTISGQDSFTIPLGKAIDRADIGRFEMEPLFLGLDNINERLNVGTIVGSPSATIVPEVKVLGNVIIPRVTGDTRTGARVTGLVQGRAGLELNAHFDLGGLGPNAAFQYTPTLNPPRNFYAGELLSLNPDNGLDPSSAFGHSQIQLPSTGVNLDVIFDIHAAGKVDYGLAGIVAYNSEPFNIPIKQPTNDDGTNFTLIGASVDLNNHETFGELTVAGDRIPIDPGGNDTLFKYQIKMDPTPPPKNGEDPLFHRDIGEVAFVKPELGNTLLVDTTLADERISYAIDSKILRLGVDIDGIASALAAGNSYTRFSKTLGDPESDFNATLAGELVDLKYGPELGYRYESSIDTKFDVNVQFSRPVAIVAENHTRVTDQFSGRWDALPDVAVLGDDAVEVEVTFTNADFLLNEQGAITISDYLEFNALSLDASINVGPLPIPVVSLGPVLHARTSVLEHIDFPDIPEPPQVGPIPAADPFATIRATKSVLDAIGEIQIFENIGKELINIAWEDGSRPAKQFVLQPQPSVLVYLREGRGGTERWEKLGGPSGKGEDPVPNAGSKLVFGLGSEGQAVESEGDLEPVAFLLQGQTTRFFSDMNVQSVKILEGSVLRTQGRTKWTSNRFENNGQYFAQGTGDAFHAPITGVLSIDGAGEMLLTRPVEIHADHFMHGAGHTMRFTVPPEGKAHEFNVTQTFQNHGTFEMSHSAKDLALTEGFTNTGTFQVANSRFKMEAPTITNDGVVATALGDTSVGHLSVEGFPNLHGNGRWVAQHGGSITFGHFSKVARDANLSFVVDDGQMDFNRSFQIWGNAEFIVGEAGTLNLQSLEPIPGSNLNIENRGTINVTGNASFDDPSGSSLVPVSIDNASGTIRIHRESRLAFDAKIADYAEGGVTFDAGTWELIGAPYRWDNNDFFSLPGDVPTASLAIRVVGVGNDDTLGEVSFEGDPDYSVDDFDTAMKINASNILLSGAAYFPYLNTIQKNRGSIRLEKGIKFHTVGSFTNTGEMEVGANSDLIVRGDLLVHGGSLSFESPERGVSGDLGKYGGRLFVENQNIEVVGAELNFEPNSSVNGVGQVSQGHEDNGLWGDWLVRESSTIAADGSVLVTPAKVSGVGGKWGIEMLNGSVVLDGMDAEFASLNSLRLITGKLEITGGNEYRNAAANARFIGVPAKVLRVREGGALTVEHGGAMYADGIEAFGNLTLGANGSLSVMNVFRADSRYAGQVTVDGILAADQVLIGAGTPNGKNRTTLEGNGRIVANVEVQQGVLKPGDEDGLRILGELQLSSTSITRFLLDNDRAQARLSVDGATLSGSLEVLSAPGFDPRLDELVELVLLNEDPSEVSSQVIAGQFDSIRLPTTLSGKAFELSVTAQGVFLDPYLLGDFNGDDLRTVIDIDLLSSKVREMIGEEQFDLNADGLVDGADRVVWVEDLGRTFFGDADLSGAVEFADFLTLSGNFGALGDWADGDFDGNGQIDFPDFLLLSGNFGQSGNTALSVPEPAGEPVALVSLLALMAFFRSAMWRARQ